MDTKLTSTLGIIILAAVMRIPAFAPAGSPQLETGAARSSERRLGLANQTEAKSTDKETELVSESDLGPWNATCEFFKPQKANLGVPAEMVPLTSRKPVTSREKWCLPQNEASYRYHFLFALVPDPVDTHLALDFDRRIEAILDASQTSGFSYDRYWLPWEAGYVPPQDSSKTNEKVVHQLRAEQPGLLLFRSHDGDGIDDILLIFLIGETPTAGIHRLQFANAMRYMAEIDNSQFQDPVRMIPKHARVLGPSFSGSAYSLLNFLDQFTCDRCFELVVSSATNPAALNRLRDSKVLRMQQVMHDDDWALGHFLDFVRHDLHFHLRDVALLTEDATDYGMVHADGKDGTGPKTPPQNCSSDPEACLDFVLTIAFPREIAQLRNAYPESPATAAASKDAPIPQQGLTLTLKGTATSQDDVPPFSGSQLPLSQEAVLLNIAATLRREQIRMVGIMATDVFDILFLSRFLRDACPDIRIFVVQGDLLTVRAAEDIPLDGMLAVTTYPLIGRNQYWTANRLEAKHRNLLPSADAQATYNATIALLQDIHPPPATLSRRPLEYSSPFDPQVPTPPLWLTVIGHNAYWPLALLDEREQLQNTDTGSRLKSHPAGFWLDREIKPTDAPDAVCKEPGESFECEPPPILWSLVLGAICCWSAVCLVAVWWARSAQKNERYFWLVYFALKEGEPKAKTTERAFYLLMEALILAELVLVIVIPAWKVFDLEPSQYISWYSAVLILSYLSILLIAGLLVTALYLTRAYIRTRPSDSFSHRTVWVFIGWILFAVLCLSWVSFCYQHSRTPSFFAYRALDLASGASPATPFLFLLAGFYSWARVHMHRLRYSETRRPALPDGLDRVLKAGTQNLDERFERSIRELYDRKLFFCNLGIFVLAFMLAHPVRYLRTLEGPWFDTLYIFCFALLYFAICSNWIRFLLGWSFMHQFLQRLEDQPWRLAFSRLSKELSWEPIWRQGGTSHTYLLLTRSADYLRALLNNLRNDAAKGAVNALPFPKPSKRFEDKCGDVQTKTKEVLDDAGRNRWDDAGAVCDLNKSLAACATDLLPSLQQRWDKGTSDLVKDPAPPKDGDSTPETELSAHLAEEFLALRCVAFIRYGSLQLRNLLGFLSTAFILSVISLHAYPFQAPHSITLSMTAVFLLFSAGIVWVFAKMDKDTILSRLSKSNPGELDRQFLMRVISFGSLPLLTVLASQFPSIGHFLFSWVRPGLEALR